MGGVHAGTAHAPAAAAAGHASVREGVSGEREGGARAHDADGAAAVLRPQLLPVFQLGAADRPPTGARRFALSQI